MSATNSKERFTEGVWPVPAQPCPHFSLYWLSTELGLLYLISHMSEHRLWWACGEIREGRAKLTFLRTARTSQVFWAVHELAEAAGEASFLWTGWNQSPRSPWFSRCPWIQVEEGKYPATQKWTGLVSPTSSSAGQGPVSAFTSSFHLGNMGCINRRCLTPLPSTSGHLSSQNSGATENQLSFALWGSLAQDKYGKILSGREELRLGTLDQTSLGKKKKERQITQNNKSHICHT